MKSKPFMTLAPWLRLLSLIWVMKLLLLGPKNVLAGEVDTSSSTKNAPLSSGTHIYPRVNEISGKVFIAGKDGVKKEATKGQILVETATLQTGNDGKISLQIDAVRTVYLDEETTLVLPSISWETSETPYLYLQTGTLRWTSDAGKAPPYSIRLQSPLYEFVAPDGEYVLTMNPTVPFCELRVLRGKIEFSALNADTSALVKESYKIKFVGFLDSGEIAYDVLLRGKKIPRGQLHAPQKMDEFELKQYSFEEQRKKQQAEEKKRQQIQQALLKKKIEGQICKSPSAKFNECSWICKNNLSKNKKICAIGPSSPAQCLRYRCDANGNWSDETLVDSTQAKELCKAKPQVGPCL